MSAFVISLIASAGVYAYIGLYYGALYALRRQHEHLVFAGMCGSFAFANVANAAGMCAPSVADAVPAQTAVLAGIFGAIGFFVDFVLHLADGPDHRVVRAVYTLAAAAVGAAAAGLLLDPAFADSSYDWGATTPDNRPSAALTPLGTATMLALISAAAYAIVVLFVRARANPELRGAAIVTSLGLVAGALDVVARALGLRTHQLVSHAALLPVLGFSYVLIGRFTRIDAQLADRTARLAQSYDHLRMAQDQLVKTEQLAAVGELSAVIAHEVRNPLAIIKNAVGGLRRRELGQDDADTLLGILDEETDRLNRLVDDLLAYARPISPMPGQVDMRTLVMHAVELAAGGNPNMLDIELELELERDVDRVEGDEALLRHALINIVDNAIQAMPDGGTLTIRCRNTNDERPSVAVEFHDTGEGMDTLVRNKARDPFFTTRQSGTGLGLAIVDRVARAHGGRVEIESFYGRGTTVRFIVPRELRSGESR